MTITWQTPEQRIAELEGILSAIMQVHVPIVVENSDGTRYYGIGTGGCDVDLTARQYTVIKHLLKEEVGEDVLTDELIELIQAPLEDRNAHVCFPGMGYYYCLGGETWTTERITDGKRGPVGAACPCTCHSKGS